MCMLTACYCRQHDPVMVRYPWDRGHRAEGLLITGSGLKAEGWLASIRENN